MRLYNILFKGLLLTLLFVEACSPLDLVDKVEDSFIQETEITTKGLNTSEIYYHYNEEKVYLHERANMLFLKFVDNESRESFLEEYSTGVLSMQVYKSEGENCYDAGKPSDILILESITEDIADDYLLEMLNREDIVSASRLLEYHGQLMARNNVFSVKLNNKANFGTMNDLATQYGCEVWRHDWTGEDVYYLSVPKNAEIDAITLSNLFFETGLFEFSSPDFYVQVALCSTDTYYAYQWGLKNTGQYNNTSGKDIYAEAAWNITEGSSDITIAVIDQGVELAHPDLAANIVAGYDATTDTSPAGGPVYNWESHGTEVAGIIGAVKDNGIGIAGVAPGCKIMPIRIWLESNNNNYTQLASAFDWARTHGADVINCSWGGIAPNNTLTTAITDALTLGRNGKGCVVVFSSGNENGTIPYPANLGGVLTVGAISYDGNRKSPSSQDGEFWWGSNYGAELNLAAPGVMIPTTTINSAYTTGFGGTSAAAPHVSGVAGLILSQYPDLTQVQVKRAMERSADRPSIYSYVTDYQYPSGRRCDQVGYGIVDAYGALNVASQIHQQNIIDALSGFDVTITNNTSYTIDDISVELYGTIGGSTVTLFSENMEPVDGGGHMVGYPVYRGAELYATPGATISNISLEFYASCSACPDNLRIAVEIDNSTPTNFESFYFGDGDFYVRSIPNSTVPNASRRRLYIYILNS